MMPPKKLETIRVSYSEAIDIAQTMLTLCDKLPHKPTTTDIAVSEDGNTFHIFLVELSLSGAFFNIGYEIYSMDSGEAIKYGAYSIDRNSRSDRAEAKLGKLCMKIINKINNMKIIEPVKQKESESTVKQALDKFKHVFKKYIPFDAKYLRDNS